MSLRSLATAARDLLDAARREISQENRAELRRLDGLPRREVTSSSILPGPTMVLVDGPSFAAQYREIWQQGIYDVPWRAPDPVIIDAGANVGTAVRFWADRYSSAQITAFEPDATIFSILEKNTSHLKCVTLHQSALSTPALGGSFAQEGSDGGRLSQTDGNSSVPISRLADVLSNLGHVDLLKVDIEGAETSVLVDAKSALLGVDRLFVEYHSFAEKDQHELPQILALLATSGFRLHMDAPSARLRPFHPFTPYAGMDMQLNISGWRSLTRI